MKNVYNKFKTELLDSCVPFWLKNGIDTQFGGVLNCLDRTGKVYSEDKSVWMQGRAGWMFSYIYNHIDKNEEYLKFAKSCIPTAFIASKIDTLSTVVLLFFATNGTYKKR